MQSEEPTQKPGYGTAKWLQNTSKIFAQSESIRSKKELITKPGKCFPYTEKEHVMLRFSECRKVKDLEFYVSIYRTQDSARQFRSIQPVGKVRLFC